MFRGRPVRVLVRLPLDSDQRRALTLRLDDGEGPAVDEEEVVGPPVAGLERELPHGDASAGAEVDPLVVLHVPAGEIEQPVDLDASLCLGLQVGTLVRCGHA